MRLLDFLMADGAVFTNDVVQDYGLNKLSTGKKLVLCSSDPTTKALATSTGFCCGISTHLDFVALAAGTTSGRMLQIKKTSDISAKACSTKWITHVAVIGTTLLFVTKCSSRSYSTAGPDLITVSSWKVTILDATT